MFCPDCGKEVPAGSKFCPGCGKATGAVPNVPTASASGQAVTQASPNDVEQNKGMAVLAYILFFIPLLAGTHKTSPFVKYHTNQGIVLVIFCVAFGIIYSIFAAILAAIAFRALLYGSGGAIAAVSLILGLLWIFPLILVIIGIVNAATGKMKPLPLIGKFTILK